MPRSKFDKDRFPPVDKVRAAILDRKMSMKKSWADIAEACNINGDYLRRLVATTPSEDWNPALRNAMCRYLGLRIHSEIQDLFDLTEDGK